jgi:hypothetical protein
MVGSGSALAEKSFKDMLKSVNIKFWNPEYVLYVFAVRFSA